MGNRAFSNTQIRVLSPSKYQQHLDRIENSREVVCIVNKTGKFENVNEKFKSLLRFHPQTDLSQETIFNFFPKKQPDSKKNSLKFLYEQLEQLSNSTSGWHKFNWCYQVENNILIPTRTIITIYQVSNKILFQLVSKCIKKKINKRAKKKFKQKRLTTREEKKQRSLSILNERPIQRSLTYSGLLIEERRNKYRTQNIRRKRTAQAKLYKPISFERIKPIHHRFRTPDLIPKNFSYLDFSKLKFKNKKRIQNDSNDNDNDNYNDNNNKKNNSERNETIKHTNIFYLNKKINNSVNEKQQLQNEKNKIKTLYQLNISENHNSQNQKNNTYPQQENFKSSKVTNSNFFQIYSNLVQEEKTELIFSCIDLIKDLVRDLDNHYLEYQVTNSLNDISDLVIKTENYFDKKIKSTHFKDQGLKKNRLKIQTKK